MIEDERIWAVKRLLFDYVKSPSLRHIRDPHSVTKLAHEIVTSVDRGNSIWRKWDGQREQVLKSSVGCWIPLADLSDYLNQLPGPRLTTTDVAQRLRAFEDEDYYTFPKDELRAGCEALYATEKAEGTEIPAIIGVIREHVEREEERLYRERQERYRQIRDEDKQRREERLQSGADCGWTQLGGAPFWFCRMNGRTYRLSPTQDKMWELERLDSLDANEGAYIGKYRTRGDATKVIKEMAYRPEPRW